MKILVVLDDEHEEYDPNSLLIRKAIMLANGLGATLELLKIVHDQSLELSLFLKERQLQSARAGLLSAAGDRLSALTNSLQSQGLRVTQDVRWGHPRPAAIVKKIKEGGSDLVMKEARAEHSLFELFSNTDWELLRDSPVPVYFVKSANAPGAGVLVALEGFTSEAGSESAHLDYAVYRHGRQMAENFSTPLTVVHAYQVPKNLAAYVGYSALIADTVPPPEFFSSLSESQREEQQAVAEQHTQAIRDFADFFEYPVADIVVREGQPDHIISEEAHLRQSGLVVMGSSGSSRLDHLFRKATAQPTLAEVQCDILFVKPTGDPRATQAERTQNTELPNLESALTNPSSA